MDLANTTTTEISIIDGLAQEARALRAAIELNLWQLARVFVEAEPLIPHGEWEKWLEENAGMSVRSAQQMIQTYHRFGGKPQFECLGKSQLFKMLALPEEIEDEFMETHDVASMSAREIEKAVKEARAEMQAEIDRERNARQEAERRAEEAENRPPEIPEELTRELEESREKLAVTQAEIDRMKETGETMLEENKRIAGENSRLQNEVKIKDALLNDQQEDIKRTQAELKNIKSTIAAGDAERVPADQLTPEAFAGAVRQFIGTVARMPHMRVTFSMMDNQTKEEYSVLLETVEKWAKDSRKALETTGAEGTVY